MNNIKKHPFVLVGTFFAAVFIAGHIFNYDNPAEAVMWFGGLGGLLTTFCGWVEYHSDKLT